MNGHASLNRFYRLVWSQVTQSWHAVSELTKSNGKGGSRSLVLSTIASVVLAGGSFKLYAQQAPPATQLPTGGIVAQGTASIAQTATAQAARMTVNQSSQRAVINWNSFNVGQNASVVFNQPNAQAVTLNRITDQNPSQIYGQVQANGQVFLTNPNGVYFSPTSQVDVGALVATTHSISDNDFMAGNNVFSRNGATGSVVNEGQLNAGLGGYIALLAPEVRNSGVVIAQAGTVALAAGEVITLNINGSGGMLGISTTPSTIASLIENRQAVQAPDGQIILSAVALSKLQAGVIKNSGSLEANSISNKGGVITLEGDDITLSSTSRISATGATGGGTVLVGGDWQGSGSLRQATKVTMEADATIDASATQQGDGGKVVLWSDVHNAESQTLAHGKIQANAGRQSGDGGQIETSGHVLNVNGVDISAQAPSGSSGTWLLDPTDFTIASSGGDITGAVLSAALNSARVVIQSDSSLNGAITATNVGTVNRGGQGDIVINDNISWTNKTSGLILKASGVIYGAGNIAFNAASTSYFQTPMEGVISFNQAGDSVARGVSYSGVVSGGITLTQTFGNTVSTSQMPVSIYVNNLVSGPAGNFVMSGVNTVSSPMLMLSKGTLSLSGSGDFSSSATKVTMLSTSNLDISGKTGDFSVAELNSVSNSTPTINLGANSLNITAVPSLISYQTWQQPNISYNTFTGVISGTGGVSLTGATQLMQGQTAGLTFTGVNTYTGATTINANTILRLDGAGSVASSSSIIDNGILDIGGVTSSTSIARLSGNGRLYLNSPATNAVDASTYPYGLIPIAAGAAKSLTITNASSADTFSGVISGTGALTLAAGTQVLTGTNTYTGDTTINNGATLQIGNGGTTGALAGASNIVDNGTLTFKLSSSPTITNAISGSGSIHNDGSGSTSLTGTLTYSGTNVVNAGLLCAGPCPFNITLQTTQAQMQAITQSQITGLQTSEVQGLSTTQMGYLTSTQLGYFSTSQLQLLSSTQVQAVTASLSNLTSAQVGAMASTLTSSQVTSLSAGQLGVLTAAQVGAMVSFLSTTQVAALSAAQINGLSSTQLASMSAVQLAAFTSGQLSAISSSQQSSIQTALANSSNSNSSNNSSSSSNSNSSSSSNNSSSSSSSSVSSSTTPAQIQNLSNSQAAQLTVNQLSGLSPAQLMAFTPSQQAAMLVANPVAAALFSPSNPSNPATVGGALTTAVSTGSSTSSQGAQSSQSVTTSNAVVPTLAGSAPAPSAIMGMSGSQMSGMSVSSVQAISPTSLSVLSGAQVAGFTPAQVSGLTPAQVQAFTPTQVAAMSNTQVQSLTQNQVSAMSANQLSAMSPAQVQSMSVQQMEALSPAQAQAVISSNGSALSPAQRTTLVATASATGSATADASGSATTAANSTGADTSIGSGVATSASGSGSTSGAATSVASANGSSAVGTATPTAVGNAGPGANASTGNVTTLTAATQVQSLKPAEIRQLTPTQISSMTPAQVQTLSAKQIATLSPTQVQSLDATQVQSLQPQQLSGLPIKQVAAFSPDQLSTMNRQQAVALMRSRANTLNTSQSSFTPEQRAAVNKVLSAEVTTSNATTSTATNGVLPVTVVGSAATPGLAVRFDGQNAAAIKLQMAESPVNTTVSAAGLNARYTTVEARNANNDVVTFKAAIVKDRLVINTGTAAAKQMARTELPSVMSNAIDTLSSGSTIAVDSLKGIVLNMR